MLHQHHVQVNSDIYALGRLQEWFDPFQDLLPKSIWMQCNLVLVEVFTNVVSYAHAKLPEETPIDIELNIDDSEKSLEMKIYDHGEPFDIDAEVERVTKEAEKNQDFDDIDDIPTGGRGLMIATTIADEIRYEVISDGRNCFVMIKSFADAR